MADLDSWLQTNPISYTPNAGFAGSDPLTMLTEDGGNSGDGGPQTGKDTVALTVVDTRAPVLLQAKTSEDGKQIVLLFDEQLDAQNLPLPSAFALAVTSTTPPANPNFSVSSVGVNGKTVVLVLDNTLNATHSVKLSYSATQSNTNSVNLHKAGNDIIFGDGFAGTDIIFSGPASGATGGQGGYGGGGAAGAISTSVPLQASIGGGAGGFGDSYLVSSGSAPTNPSYAGKANTMGMASPVDLFSSGNGLYLPAPGAGVTTNGSSFT